MIIIFGTKSKNIKENKGFFVCPQCQTLKQYLIKSIQNFVNQEELLDLMKKNNFKKCTYRNLSGGIVAIHSGWKI